jgi:hypothetical protein
MSSHAYKNDMAFNSVLCQPWHLMNNGYDYLFWNKKRSVNVRYLLPFTRQCDIQPVELPIRILLINSRPEDDDMLTDTDHRFFAKPLIHTVQTLGGNVTLHILKPPTFLELEHALDTASQAGRPYHVVHFDGHWVNHPESGIPGFCFEAPEMMPDSQKRKVNIIDANQLAKCMQLFKIPLVFLGTCQHPSNNFAQVITDMLQKGVSSIVTFPYKLMPESTTQFFQFFYLSLAGGDRITQAMLAGLKAIKSIPLKNEVFYNQAVYVYDWFVPTLIQRSDPQLFHYVLTLEFEPNEHNDLFDNDELYDSPAKNFVNRSKEFLYIERLLENDKWALIQSNSGEGKTALALEMARWFMKTSRVEQVVYVKLNYTSTVTSILHSIGDQVIATSQSILEEEWQDYTYAVLKKIFEKRTLLIFDNMEMTCPSYIDCMITSDLNVIYNIYSLLVRLLEIPETKLILNTTKDLGEPFNTPTNVFHLASLNKTSAIELIHASMKEGGYHHRLTPEGRPEGDIERLIKAVHYHPRCLKSLAPTIYRRGINLAFRKISTLMNKIAKNYPDPKERAMAASIELSIQKLSETTRKYLDYLAVFHVSINQMLFTQITGDFSSIISQLFHSMQSDTDTDTDTDTDEMVDESGFNVSDLSWLDDSEEELEGVDDDYYELLMDELILHNLAWEYRDQLIFHPCLIEYLKNRVPKEKYANLRRKWALSIEAYIHFISNCFSDDTSYCIKKTIMDLPNIMAFIAYCIREKSPEDLLDIIERLYPIMEETDYEHILEQFDTIYDKLNELLDESCDD